MTRTSLGFGLPLLACAVTSLLSSQALAGTTRDHRDNSRSDSRSSGGDTRDHRSTQHTDDGRDSRGSSRDHDRPARSSSDHRDHRGDNWNSQGTVVVYDERPMFDTYAGGSGRGVLNDIIRAEVGGVSKSSSKFSAAAIAGRLLVGRNVYGGFEASSGLVADTMASGQEFKNFGAVAGLRVPLSQRVALGLEGAAGLWTVDEQDPVGYVEGRAKFDLRVMPVMSLGGYIGSTRDFDGTQGNVAGVHLAFHSRAHY